jgi:predicted esterase
MKTYHVETQVHGRVVIQEPIKPKSEKWPVLVGFHGYGQGALDELEILQSIPGIEEWFLISIQALHSFYPKRGRYGSSWMTSQDRELRIQENVAYFKTVLKQMKKEYPLSETLVCHGFSQGTNMACRAAMLGGFPCSGLMLVGGDTDTGLSYAKLPAMHWSRGDRDCVYDEQRWMKEVQEFRSREQIPLRAEVFKGEHAPEYDYFQKSGAFLREILLNSVG